MADDEELSLKGTIIRELGEKNRIKVLLEGEKHYVGVKSLTASSATLEIGSEPQEVTLNVGEEKKFEVTDDNFYDISVALISISDGKAKIAVNSISEEIPQAAEPDDEGPIQGIIDSIVEGSEGGLSTGLILILIAVVTVIVVVILKKKKKRS